MSFEHDYCDAVRRRYDLVRQYLDDRNTGAIKQSATLKAMYREGARCTMAKYRDVQRRIAASTAQPMVCGHLYPVGQTTLVLLSVGPVRCIYKVIAGGVSATVSGATDVVRTMLFEGKLQAGL